MSENKSHVTRSPAAKALMALVFLLVFGAVGAYAAVAGQMVWSTQYTSIGRKDDIPQAVTIGPKGSIYVTGAGAGDYATVKYGPAGGLKWAKRYHGAGSDNDGAVAVALDQRGNVYVTGTSVGAGSGPDFATIKYGPRGAKKWISRFNSRFNGEDQAAAIAVGSTGVYVTGHSQGQKTRMDYVTIKYGFDGRVKWVKRYNSPGNGNDMASKIVIDEADNVYVTGSSAGDYATLKYDSAGRLQWAARYNGPANNVDGAVGLVVDGAGNVIVAGSSQTASAAGAIAVVKYDAAGTRKWVQRYDGPASMFDWPVDIGLDPSGNIYLAGTAIYDFTGTFPFDPSDSVTIKYDSAGVRQWLRINADFDSATALAVDQNGNVVVAGQAAAGSTGMTDYATVKYDTDGNPQWAKTFSGPGNNMDFTTDVAINGKGAVYVTGAVYRQRTGDDFATVKYAP
ncbi:MAG: SBBP repeat-containing protein [Actinomycetota bacterium]|nr:SBBP repeat-containing protein [Actinomycetota bacterium]